MSLRDAAARYLPPLEEEMRAVVGRVGPEFDPFVTMLTYHMGWSDAQGQPVAANGGKRIRPLLCLMVCEAAGGDWTRAVPVAAALELLHNFSLVHDDIQDQGELRRGQPTLWKVWGVPLAINAGDALFALAHLAVVRLVERKASPQMTLNVFRILDETCLRLTQGQHLDIAFEERQQVDVESYLWMIEGKSAALLAASTQLGALVAGAPEETVEDYRQFGLSLGMAFQVTDDILGIWGAEALTGKSTDTDLQTHKKTLPVLVALERSAEFRDLYHKPGRLSQEEVTTAETLLVESGARAQAEVLASRYSDDALAHLKAAGPQGEAGRWLHLLTEELLRRDR